MAITLISTVTVGAGGASSIDFTSISGSFTDLLVVLNGRSLISGGGDNAYVKINGATTNGQYRALEGNNGSASSNNGAFLVAGVLPGSTTTTSTFGNISIYFPNYSGSTNKSFSVDSVSENNATTNYWLDAIAGLWSQTAAITSLSLYSGGANLAQYSTASLYGITKGSSGGVTVS
jgi:hypothetical protein